MGDDQRITAIHKYCMHYSIVATLSALCHVPNYPTSPPLHSASIPSI